LNNGNFTGSIVQRFNSKLSLTSYFNYSRQTSPNVPDVNYGPNSIIYNIILWGGADWNIDDMRDYWQAGKVGIQEKYTEWFLIYVSDSFGYLGSVAVIISKSIFSNKLPWAAVYSHGVMYLSVIGVAGTLLALRYFNRKYKGSNYIFEKDKELEEVSLTT
jgi:hypothetical protein